VPGRMGRGTGLRLPNRGGIVCLLGNFFPFQDLELILTGFVLFYKIHPIQERLQAIPFEGMFIRWNISSPSCVCLGAAGLMGPAREPRRTPEDKPSYVKKGEHIWLSLSVRNAGRARKVDANPENAQSAMARIRSRRSNGIPQEMTGFRRSVAGI